MDISELVIAAIYLIVILVIAYLIRRNRYRDAPEGKYFMWALWVKIIGAIAVGLIYYFYYGGGSPAGDTFSYFSGATAWANTATNDPEVAISFLFDPTNKFSLETIKANSPPHKAFYILKGEANLFMIRLTGVISFLAFKSYFATAVIFAFLSFTGVWALYRTFLKFFPNLKRNLAIAIFFIPSVVFWGSGILKDTIVIGSLGWLTYTAFKIFIDRQWSLRNIIILIISSYCILELKGYVLLAFGPALAFWVLAIYKSKINSAFLRITSTPILIALTIGIGTLIIGQISDALGRYSLENLESTARATQQWHHATNPEGSVYALNVQDFSLASMVRAIPAAINVTYFRPYPWEASGAIAYLTALESLAVLLFTIYLLIKTKVIGFFKYLNHPFIQFCLVFALVFGFAVGLTSYNFGALARYKIQSLPFFLSFLFMIKYQMGNTRNNSGN